MQTEAICQTLMHAAVDIERVLKTLVVLKQVSPYSENNPHWKMVMDELGNAQKRISHIQAAIANPETVQEIPDLPAAAPPPAPIG